MHRTTSAIATETTPFGAAVEGGIAKRPAWARFETEYQPGQEMVVLTDGGCIGADGVWVEVTNGIVVR